MNNSAYNVCLLQKKMDEMIKNELEKLVWPASSKFLHITCAETSGSRNSGRISPLNIWNFIIEQSKL